MDGSVPVGTLQLNGGSHVEFSSEDGVRAQLLSLPIREVGERMQSLALGPWGLSVTPHEGASPPREELRDSNGRAPSVHPKKE